MSGRCCGNRLFRYGKLQLALLAAVLGVGIAAALADPVEKSKDVSTRERADAVKKQIDADYAHLDALYKHLHSHPELSLQEVQTAARMARELRARL